MSKPTIEERLRLIADHQSGEKAAWLRANQRGDWSVLVWVNGRVEHTLARAASADMALQLALEACGPHLLTGVDVE